MSARPDISRVVRSWLREDEHESADQVLNIVLARLETTPQRRSWWAARRTLAMTNGLRIAIAAVFVVVVGIVGIQFLPPGPGAARVTPTPGPTPANYAALPGAGASLAPGSYTLTHVSPLTITVTLREGWYKGQIDWAIFTPGEPKDMSVAFSAVENLFVDPCNRALGQRLPAVGPGVADLVAALTTVPGVDASPAVDDVVGGYAATRLDLTSPVAPASCNSDPSMWLVPGSIAGPPIPEPGGTLRLWIVDAGGTRLVVSSLRQTDATAQQVAGLQGVVDSIRIARP